MFRLAVFTDTFDDVNGVAVIYRHFVEAAERTRAPPAALEVFCLSDRTGVQRGRASIIHRYRPRPKLPVPRYRELKTGVPPLGRIGIDFAAAHLDAVLVATPGPMGFIGKRLARSAGLPLIGFYHTRFPAYLAVYFGRPAWSNRGPELAQRLGYAWMRRLYGMCSLVVCQSDTIADEVRRASPARIAVWDTGVDTQLFRPGDASEFRSRHGIPPRAVVVAYVGRLAPEKSLDEFAVLSHELPELHFLLVGDGPMADRLRRTARATFTGYLTGNALADAYRAADIFLFPSQTDTFGMVLLEAMASGLPLVVVDGSAGAELVRRSGAGLTCPPDEPAAMAAALRRIADNVDERRRMSVLAREHARARDWASTFDQFVALCQSAGPPPQG